MGDAKYTPGPWTENGTSVHAANDQMIAAVYGDHPECKYDARMGANARLISAAPDLVEACQRTLAMLESAEGKALVGDEGCLWGVELLRAALSKAGV